MDCFADPGAVDDNLRILSTKGLRNMTVPANGKMGGQHPGYLFGGDFAPLDGFAVRAEQGRLSLQPVNLADPLAARDAMLA